MKKIQKYVAKFLVCVMILATQVHSPMLVRAAADLVLNWVNVDMSNYNVSGSLYLEHFIGQVGDVYVGLAGGSASYYWVTSTDKVYWEIRSFSFGMGNPNRTQPFWFSPGVTYGNGIRLGRGGAPGVSLGQGYFFNTDFHQTWMQARIPEGVAVNSIQFLNGRFWFLMPDGLWSTDGHTMRREIMPSDISSRHLTTQNGVLVLDYSYVATDAAGNNISGPGLILSEDGFNWHDVRSGVPGSFPGELRNRLSVMPDGSLILAEGGVAVCTANWDTGRWSQTFDNTVRLSRYDTFGQSPSFVNVGQLQFDMNAIAAELAPLDFRIGRVYTGVSGNTLSVSLNLYMGFDGFRNFIWSEEVNNARNEGYAALRSTMLGLRDASSYDSNELQDFTPSALITRVFTTTDMINWSATDFLVGNELGQALDGFLMGGSPGVFFGPDSLGTIGAADFQVEWGMWSEGVMTRADWNRQDSLIFDMRHIILPYSNVATPLRFVLNGRVIVDWSYPGGIPTVMRNAPVQPVPVVPAHLAVVQQPLPAAAQVEHEDTLVVSVVSDAVLVPAPDGDVVPWQPLPEVYVPRVPLPEMLPPQDVLVYVLEDDAAEDILLSAYEYGYSAIDLSDTGAGGVDLPSDLFEGLADIGAELVITLPGGFLELCEELVLAIANQSDIGDRIVLYLYKYQDDEIIDEVLELLCYGDEVFNVRILVGGTDMTDIDGRLAVTVTHGDTPLPGVWRIGIYGDFYPQEFISEDGRVTFFPDRLSNFVVGYSADARTIAVFRAEGDFTTLISRGREIANLRDGQRLSSGDRLVTGRDSQIFVMLDNSSILKLGENSEAEIIEAGRNLEINVIRGNVLVRVDSQEPHHATTIRAQNTTTGVRGTMFTVSVDDYGNETVAMLSGYAEVNGEPLMAGYLFALSVDGVIGVLNVMPITVEVIDTFTLAAIVGNLDYLAEHLEIDLTGVDIAAFPLPAPYEFENLVIEDFEAETYCNDDCVPLTEPGELQLPQDRNQAIRRC